VAGTVVPPAPTMLASVGRDASTPAPPFDVDGVVAPPIPPALLASLVPPTPASEETATCPPMPLDVVPPAPLGPLSATVFRLPRLQPPRMTKPRQATATANLEIIRCMVAQFRLERNAHNHHRISPGRSRTQGHRRARARGPRAIRHSGKRRWLCDGSHLGFENVWRPRNARCGRARTPAQWSCDWHGGIGEDMRLACPTTSLNPMCTLLAP
jgi:hypothetical protein